MAVRGLYTLRRGGRPRPPDRDRKTIGADPCVRPAVLRIPLSFDVTCLVAAERQGLPDGPVGGDALYRRASPLEKQSPGLFFNSPLAELFKAMQGSALHPPRALPLDPGRERAAPCTPQLFLIRPPSGGHNNSQLSTLSSSTQQKGTAKQSLFHRPLILQRLASPEERCTSSPLSSRTIRFALSSMPIASPSIGRAPTLAVILLPVSSSRRR